MAYNARGFSYYMLRNYPRALTDLDQAIRLILNTRTLTRIEFWRVGPQETQKGAADDAVRVKELTK